MSLDITLHQTTVEQVFDANITHNVAPMWRKAGCYDALYNSEGIRAGAALPFIQSALAYMKAKPEEFTPLNPENGWGSYSTALAWLDKLAKEFAEYPDAVIEVSK